MRLRNETLARNALKSCKRPASRKNTAGTLKKTWLIGNLNPINSHGEAEEETTYHKQ